MRAAIHGKRSVVRSGEDSKWNIVRSEFQFGKVSAGEKIDSINWRASLKVGFSGLLTASRGSVAIKKQKFPRILGLARSAGSVAK
jgi:hypothetical protein